MTLDAVLSRIDDTLPAALDRLMAVCGALPGRLTIFLSVVGLHFGEIALTTAFWCLQTNLNQTEKAPACP